MKHVSLVKNARLIGQLCLYLFLPFLAYEQNAKAISLLVAPRPQQVNLFLHLDKSIYQPGETVWFTGYILNRDEDLMREQNTLYALLVDPISQKPVANQRFLIKNGFGKGYLTLPDTLVAGDYWIIGYTNALLETGDQPVFRQLISLRTGTPSPFRISSATLEPDGDSLRVRYKIITSYKGLASGGKFTYTLFDSTNTLVSGEKTIDAFGEVTVAVGARSDAGKPREITAIVSRNGLSKGFMLQVNTSQAALPETATRPEATAQPSAGQTQPFNIRIEPDSAEYHQRSLVTLRIRITDPSGRPLPAIFSLAVTASKKLDTTRTRSILQYDASPEPTPAPPSVVRQLRFLAGEMPDYGYVLLDDNAPKKPVSLALMGNGFSSLKTDAAGKFELPYSLLAAPAGSGSYVSVTERSVERYKIAVYSRADTFNRQLAAIHYPLNAKSLTLTQEPDELATQAPGMLKTAVVKAAIMTENREFAGEYNSTHCDQDYVCKHKHGGPTEPDVLNCPYMDQMLPHEKKKPVEGMRYYYVTKGTELQKSGGFGFVIYRCAVPTLPPFMKLLQPILPGKPFPLQDYSSGDGQAQALLTTVYWNHSLGTDDKGEATISFYTNDLPGNFTCILQGVSAAGVITGKGHYTVAPERPYISTASTNE